MAQSSAPVNPVSVPQSQQAPPQQATSSSTAPQPPVSQNAQAVTQGTSTQASASPKQSIKFLALGMIVAVFGLVGWLGWRNGWFSRVAPIPVSAQIEMKAMQQEYDGVSPSTSFVITSSDPISPQTIKANLQIDPPVKVSVTRTSPTEVVVVPEAPLEKEKIYSFQLLVGGDSKEIIGTWAFQTQGEFRITQSLPRNAATSVGKNTSIEITFSSDSFGDPEKYVKMSPEIEGRWERHYKTAVFVPKSLKTNELYTITVDRSLPLEHTNKTLAKDYVFQFETSANHYESDSFSLNNELNEFGTQTTPQLRVSTYRQGGATLDVKVYAYDDSDAFAKAWTEKQKIPAWANETRRSYRIPTQGMREVVSFSTQLQEAKNGSFLLPFPEPLSVGWYAVEVTKKAAGQDQKMFTWIQVTDMAAYFSASKTQSMVWAVDRAQNTPAKQAEVSLWGGSKLGKTGDDGVLTFSTPAELQQQTSLSITQSSEDQQKEPKILKISLGNSTIFIPSYTSNENQWNWMDRAGSATEQFWKYISFDKPIYKPGDTVRFWGVLKDRDGKDLNLKDLRAEVRTSLYTGDKTPIVRSQPIKLNEDGSFQSELTLPILHSSWYSVVLVDGTNEYMSQGIEVESYVKPAYSLDFSFEKRAAFAGESVKMSGRGTFFDGTPVSKLGVMIYTGYEETKQTIRATADASGAFEQSTALIAPRDENGYMSSYPASQYFTVSPARAEEGEISATDYILVFPSRYSLTTQQERKGNEFAVSLTVNEVNLQNVQSQYPNRSEYIGAPVQNLTLPVSIIRQWQEKIETGERYNPYTKTVEKTYRYERREEPFRDDVVTTDGSGNASLTVPVPAEGTMVLRIGMTDSVGNQTRDVVYLYSGNGESTNEALDLVTEKELSVSQEKRYEVRYDVGEQIRFLLTRGETPIPDSEKGLYLLRLSQRGIKHVLSNTSPTFGYTYDKNDVPNLSVVAIVFDGKQFEITYPKTIMFNTDAVRLSLKLQTNKKEYVPGEKVKMDVHIEDKDGKAQQATVNLHVLDRALLALRGEGDNITDQMYTTLSSGVFRSYASHKVPEAGGAEGGGGCFLSGTPILMADGTTKSIDQVVEGDRIRTKENERSSKMVDATVEKFFSHTVSEYLIINDWLRVTPEHVVWASGGWQVAGNLRVGDLLLDERGSFVQIRSIERKYETVKVYNLSTSPQHTFFAGGIYVHNEKSDRKVFKDIVLFQNVTTDSSGNASVEFQLPDNLTSWRVSAEGFVSNTLPLVGRVEDDVVVSQSVYVTASIAEEYLVGDKPVLQLRAFGSDLKENQTLTYFVEGKTIGIPERKTFEGKAFVGTSVELPALPVGTHDLTIGVKTSNFEDKMLRKVVVKEGRLVRPTTKIVDVAKDTSFTWDGISSDMVSIVISNPLVNVARSEAYSLQYRQIGRLDAYLARLYATDWLYQEQGMTPPSFDSSMLDIYQVKGGMNLVPQSDADLYYSMLTALVAPEKVDASLLANYFAEVLQDPDSDREQQIMAFAGLAGLHQPVLVQIQHFAEVDDLSMRERMYLAAGAIAAGDQTLAKTMILPVVSTAEKTEGRMIITNLPDTDLQESSTWLTAAVAAAIKHESAYDLTRGAASLYSEETLVDLEKAFFMKMVRQAQLTQSAKITIKLPDNEVTHVFTAKEPVLRLLVSPDRLAQIQVIELEGNISALMQTNRPLSKADVGAAKYTVFRSYAVDGVQTNQFSEGSLVQVTIDHDIPKSERQYNCIQVTDWLPAGLRIVTTPSTYKRSDEMVSYPFEVETQKASFCSDGRPVMYYARVVNTGTFTTDPALAQPIYQTGSYGVSEPSSVTITPNE